MQVIKAMAKEIIGARLDATNGHLVRGFFFPLNNVHPFECKVLFCDIYVKTKLVLVDLLLLIQFKLCI